MADTAPFVHGHKTISAVVESCERYQRISSRSSIVET
jgi:hypothetical protein